MLLLSLVLLLSLWLATTSGRALPASVSYRGVLCLCGYQTRDARGRLELVEIDWFQTEGSDAGRGSPSSFTTWCFFCFLFTPPRFVLNHTW